MSRSHWILAFFCAFITGVACADPVSVTADKTFPSTVYVAGPEYVAEYTITNNLAPSLAVQITKTASPANEFTYDDQCSGKNLAGKGKGSCKIIIKLNPTSVGNKSLELQVAYGRNSVKVSQHTNAEQQITVNITGKEESPYLPPNMFIGGGSVPFTVEFHNAGTSPATGVGISSSNQNFTSFCEPTLQPGATCQVTGNFTPVAPPPTNQFVTVTFSYNQGKDVTVKTRETIVSIPPKKGLTGWIEEDLQPVSVVGETYPVRFKYKNTGDEPVPLTQQNTYPTGFSETENDCPKDNNPLNAKAECTISGTFAPVLAQEDQEITITTGLHPQTPPPEAVSKSVRTVVGSNQGSRTISFRNECNFDVWFSMSGEAMGENAPAECSKASPCPLGFECSSDTKGKCYWANYAPEDGVYKLSAYDGNSTPETKSVTINAIRGDMMWNGTFSASTGCSGDSCKTAGCGNQGGTTSCAPGESFAEPSTQAKVTYMKNSPDIYSVSIAKGFHIPIQIVADGRKDDDDVHGYICGSPGNIQTVSDGKDSVGACQWDEASVPSPSYKYYWVSDKGADCTMDSDCPSNLLCGLDSTLRRSCGKFMGYWTGDKVCSKQSDNAFYNCNGHPEGFPEDTQYRQLYSCLTPDPANPLLNSCYGPDATDQCCGAVNWREYTGTKDPNDPATPHIILPDSTPPYVKSAKAWEGERLKPGLILESLGWMKFACPTYSTYRYDDKSSTFNCQHNKPNNQDYTVVFCAGESNGLPAGKADGRK